MRRGLCSATAERALGRYCLRRTIAHGDSAASCETEAAAASRTARGSGSATTGSALGALRSMPETPCEIQNQRQEAAQRTKP